MKYLIICLIFLISCDLGDNKVEYGERANTNTSYASSVYHFQYKEHDYMEFQSGSSTWGVHNPDCLKCKNK